MPFSPPSHPVWAVCRAAGAVSLRSTPPFTPFAFAHIRSGPPSYDAEGGTGSGHPATSALASQAPPSRGWHVASCRPGLLLWNRVP